MLPMRPDARSIVIDEAVSKTKTLPREFPREHGLLPF
jgi:hypothetical protein